MTLDVPRISADWYRAAIDLAGGAPPWLRHVAEIGTDLLLAGFAVLFLLGWWRARGLGMRVMAFALLAPAVTVVSYGVSETMKALVAEGRPCRGVAEAATIAACPPVGDWSFPSNHAAVAGAAAVGVVLAWRRLLSSVTAVALALVEAASRVLVGVHYPHDVVAGLLLGAAVATVVALLAAGPVARLVTRLGRDPRLRPLLTAPAPPPRRPAPGAPSREPVDVAGRR